MRTIYRRNGREAVWRARTLRAGRESCGRRLSLEQGDEVSACLREGVALGGGQRLSTLHRKCDARITLCTADEDFESFVRDYIETFVAPPA